MYNHINQSLSVVYGSPPYGWTTPERLSEIASMVAALPTVRGRSFPLTTYLLFARSHLRFDLSTQFSAVFSEKIKNSFSEHLLTLPTNAKVQVSLDDGNFKAEVVAFGDMSVAISEPHLDISPLYRYMAAIQQGMLSCVTDSLVADAIHCLRVNPYLYYEYGDDYTTLMPITWEGI